MGPTFQTLKGALSKCYRWPPEELAVGLPLFLLSLKFWFLFLEGASPIFHRSNSSASFNFFSKSNPTHFLFSFTEQIPLLLFPLEKRFLLKKMASKTTTKDIITLRGSAAIVSEFFGMFSLLRAFSLETFSFKIHWLILVLQFFFFWINFSGYAANR